MHHLFSGLRSALKSKLVATGNSGRTTALRRAVASVVDPLESRQHLDAVIDLRLAGGGQRAEISSRDQVVEMEVWATITGSNNDGSDDGLQILAGSFLSSNRQGGAVKGTLKAARDPAYFNTGSSNGRSVDLDGDGDLDVGSNDDSTANGFFAARALASPTQGGTVEGGSQSFLVGTVKFTAEQFLAGESTRIVFRPRGSSSSTPALWVEDGQPRTTASGTLKVGTAVTLVLAPGTTPDDTTPPTATLTAGDVSQAGASAYTFKVRYADEKALKLSSLGDGDVRVTGPNDFSQAAQFLSSETDKDGSVTATYRVVPPGGNWNAADNGTYAVALQAGQVLDSSDNAAEAGKLGSFQVQIASAPPPPSIPAKLANGVLTVTGTKAADTISVSLVKGKVRVTFDGRSADFDAGKVSRLVVNAGSGNDNVTLRAGSLPGNVDGGSGDDKLTGGDARDSLFGSSGHDQLLGGGNNDLLLGGPGNDLIDGQSGNDKFDGGSGNDRMNGSAGNDTVDYSARNVPMKISLDGKANDGLKGETDNVAADVEQVLGGKSHDLITGSGADNVLVGGAGNDTIRAGAGNDKLTGGPGADQLFGDDGNDSFDARDGSIDSLTGGGGTDSAKLDKNDKRTSIERLLA